MPAAFPGIRGQTQNDDYIDFSGTITSGGTAQIVLPQQIRRLSLYFQNLSTDVMYVGFGPPRPVATLSGSTVNAISVSGNAGFGFKVIPQVVIQGGIVDGDYQTSPANPATAHVNGLSGSGGITGITVDNPGSGYVVAPLVRLVNPMPTLGGGAFLPSTGVGIYVAPSGGFFSMGGSLLIPVSALGVVAATTGDVFTCKVAIE